MSRHLPILQNLRVATPCAASWDSMQGDGRVRHCGDCKKNVYNLSGMMRADAEALLVENHGNLCVRYYQRADGTILLADCAVGVSKRRRRRLVAAGAAALLAGGLAVRAGSTSSNTNTSTSTSTSTPELLTAVMGGSAANPEPPPAAKMGGLAAVAPPVAIVGKRRRMDRGNP